jgi:hypothetical protein
VHPNIGEFAGIFIAFYIAHGVADHWLQTSHQAANKGRKDRAGAMACARHVATYTTATAVLVAWTIGLFGLHVSWLGFVAAQVISAATHYWADRRYTLAGLCDILGKGDFYRLGAPRQIKAHRVTLLSGQEVVRLAESKTDPDPIPWDNPSLGTGAYALDQWWHLWWLFIAAVITVAL